MLREVQGLPPAQPSLPLLCICHAAAFIFTPGSAPPPWGCCPEQMLCVGLPGAAPCWDVIPVPGRCPCLLGENSGAARGVWIRQLGCRTDLPLNSTSLVSLLCGRHGAVRTKGGDQPWGGWWESAKETAGWAPKPPGHPAEHPCRFASCTLLCKGNSEKRNS